MDSSAYLDLDLTLEQEFELRRFQDSAQEMSREQAVSLLLKASRLLMVKDNVIKDLIKQNLTL
ncbi:MAG: NblA/ycf18 family protein [Cyanophyceae cyanobacterium]